MGGLLLARVGVLLARVGMPLLIVISHRPDEGAGAPPQRPGVVTTFYGVIIVRVRFLFVRVRLRSLPSPPPPATYSYEKKFVVSRVSCKDLRDGTNFFFHGLVGSVCG